MSNGRRWFEQAPPEPRPGPRQQKASGPKLRARCPPGKDVLSMEILHASWEVCPSCGRCLHIDACSRLRALVDPESSPRRDEYLVSVDALGFVDDKPRLRRLADACERTAEHLLEQGMIDHIVRRTQLAHCLHLIADPA